MINTLVVNYGEILINYNVLIGGFILVVVVVDNIDLKLYGE